MRPLEEAILHGRSRVQIVDWEETKDTCTVRYWRGKRYSRAVYVVPKSAVQPYAKDNRWAQP